jgi:hypothetical protein
MATFDYRDYEQFLTSCVQDSLQVISETVGTPSRAAIDNIQDTQGLAHSSRAPAPQRSRPSASFLLNALPSEDMMLQFLEEYMNSVRRDFWTYNSSLGC